MRIIPAIDIYNGKCVRLAQGVFTQRTEYSDDPHSTVRRFVASGARHLHIVDLEGAKEGRPMNRQIIADILSGNSAEIQVGGGIRNEEEIEEYLAAGAARIVVGSVAIRSPDVFDGWCRRFGPEKFCVALDIKDGRLAHSGWLESVEAELHTVIKRMASLNVRRFLSTDIRRDGLLGGPNVGLYAELVHSFPSLEWIASGGVHSREDVIALQQTGVFGTVIGKALYEGTIRLEDVLDAAC